MSFIVVAREASWGSARGYSDRWADLNFVAPAVYPTLHSSPYSIIPLSAFLSDHIFKLPLAAQGFRITGYVGIGWATNYLRVTGILDAWRWR